MPEAVVEKVAVAPLQTVWSGGSVVVVTTTVSVAAVVVAEPELLVNSARYWLPLSARVAVNMSVVLVAPGILLNGPPVLTCHCTVGVGKPLAAAVKVAVPPSQTVWLVGLVVTVGATGSGLIVIEAVTVALSTVASALPLPGTAPAVNVAFALPALIVGSAPEIVPRTALLKVTVLPLRATRSLAAIALPALFKKKSACKVVA